VRALGALQPRSSHVRGSRCVCWAFPKLTRHAG
jgi:hypothetical protein